eukprot:6202777-Pleurochrysis_carterae.AAC.1
MCIRDSVSADDARVKRRVRASQPRRPTHVRRLVSALRREPHLSAVANRRRATRMPRTACRPRAAEVAQALASPDALATRKVAQRACGQPSLVRHVRKRIRCGTANILVQNLLGPLPAVQLRAARMTCTRLNGIARPLCVHRNRKLHMT